MKSIDKNIVQELNEKAKSIYDTTDNDQAWDTLTTPEKMVFVNMAAEELGLNDVIYDGQ